VSTISLIQRMMKERLENIYKIVINKGRRHFRWQRKNLKEISPT